MDGFYGCSTSGNGNYTLSTSTANDDLNQTYCIGISYMLNPENTTPEERKDALLNSSWANQRIFDKTIAGAFSNPYTSDDKWELAERSRISCETHPTSVQSMVMQRDLVNNRVFVISATSEDSYARIYYPDGTYGNEINLECSVNYFDLPKGYGVELTDSNGYSLFGGDFDEFDEVPVEMSRWHQI